MIRIGIDANGGDFGVKTTVPGALLALKEFNDIEIVFYGDEEKIKPYLEKEDTSRIKIVNTKVTLSMGEEDPVRAIRKQKDSSMSLAMYAAKNDEVDAVVTSGPTQCVVLGAHVIIRRIPEMERVALCPLLPNLDGRVRLYLDSGANVELKKEHYGQFAIFATITAQELLGIKNPTVGYLNIGSEPGKGREIDKEAYEYLSHLEGINFYGNIEPNQVVNCPTDIVLADGYSGNICLKAIEGTAKGMSGFLKSEIKSSFKSKIGYLFMRKVFKNLAKTFDSKEVGGAMVLGIGKPVIKAHGNSNAYAFRSAIVQARNMVNNDVIGKVIKKLPKREENTNE